MNWSENSETYVHEKSQPRLGRRANQSTVQSPDEDFGSTDDILNSVAELHAVQAPSHIRKTGGWAEDTLKSAKNKNSTNLIEQERFQEQKIDYIDDIPVIPDIDEIQDDNSPEVAEAPTVTHNRVTTYKELNSDLVKQKSFTHLGDTNISILSRFMYPEKDIRETDETWTKESLFNELFGNYRGDGTK